jgi:hypothetical protein
MALLLYIIVIRVHSWFVFRAETIVGVKVCINLQTIINTKSMHHTGNNENPHFLMDVYVKEFLI